MQPEPIAHRIADDLNGSWLDAWVEEGLAELDSYLAKHAAFERFLQAHAAS